MAADKEITIRDFKMMVKGWWTHLLSKWIWFAVISIVFGLLGIWYAWQQKPLYTAEITFEPENNSSSTLGAYAGLAAQFGVDMSAGGGTVFEGDNLMELLRSRLLIQKTLLTPVMIDGKKELLVNYYIRANKIDKDWKKDTALRKVVFTEEQTEPLRVRDSLMKKFCKEIVEGALAIDKIDRKLSIVSVKMTDENELFAKMFVEQLVNNATQYYIDYKVKKSRQNVAILQRQTDSIRSLLTGNIVAVAVSNDLNVNPIRQVVRAGVQRKQVDVQVNSAVYAELVKQLEISKVSLRKETPLIQFIDTPQLPLDKKKLGRLRTGILFGMGGFFACLAFFVLKRTLSN